VDPPTFWLEPSPGAVGEGVPLPPPFDGEGLPVPPGVVGDGEGERAGGTEKGSRPVKLWIGGTPPPGEGVGDGVPGVTGGPTGGSASSPPPRQENNRKPASSTPTTMPPIVTVRRSRAVSAIDQTPGIVPCSVGPGSDPGPELTSAVYSVIVAANERVVPVVGFRSIDCTVAARGRVSISCRYFTRAK
jgi:hypothetical protein